MVKYAQSPNLLTTMPKELLMLISPELKRGVDYKMLKVTDPESQNGTWRFLVLREIQFKYVNGPRPDTPAKQYYSVQRDEDRLVFRSDCLGWTIYPGYAWDGNTPKKGFNIIGDLDLWVGTPDFESTISECLIHDAMCQAAATWVTDISSWRTAAEIYQWNAKRKRSKSGKLYSSVLRHLVRGFYWGKPDLNVAVKIADESCEQTNSPSSAPEP